MPIDYVLDSTGKFTDKDCAMVNNKITISIKGAAVRIS